jgi:hypothetical protein
MTTVVGSLARSQVFSPMLRWMNPLRPQVVFQHDTQHKIKTV